MSVVDRAYPISISMVVMTDSSDFLISWKLQVELPDIWIEVFCLRNHSKTWPYDIGNERKATTKAGIQAFHLKQFSTCRFISVNICSIQMISVDLTRKFQGWCQIPKEFKFHIDKVCPTSEFVWKFLPWETDDCWSLHCF